MTDRRVNNVNIGIFGGTFDPIHYGHLRAAEEVRESFDLKKILFIPCATPPHKDRCLVSPACHRLEMARIATRGHPVFHVSDLECRREEVSYSIETLRILRGREGSGTHFYFIAGLDAFLEVHTWRDYEALFDLTHWIVLRRPGSGRGGARALPRGMAGRFRYDPSGRSYLHESGHRVHFANFRRLEISGTEIRRLIARGQSVRYLVPDGIVRYIRRHRLYAGDGI